MLDGIRKGNSAKPADKIVPAIAVPLATKAVRFEPRRANSGVTSAATIATAAAAIAHRPSGPFWNQLPPIEACLRRGLDAPSVTILPSTRNPLTPSASHAPAAM